MKSVFSRILALSVLCLGTTYAGQAAFHLPFDAYWGKMSLPAGDYRVTLPEAGETVKLFYVNGPRSSSFAVAANWQGGYPNGHSYLTLVELDGQFYVREYSSGATGTSYLFLLPNKAHHMHMAEHVIPAAVGGTN